MRLLRASGLHPAICTATDLAVLRQQREDEATLRIVTWQPYGLSVGLNNPNWRQVDENAVREAGYSLVRRHTPGGGVLIGDRELLVAFFVPRRWFGAEYTRRTGFCVLSEIMRDALGRLGALVEPNEVPKATERKGLDCFADVAQCELSVEGRKVVGGAASASPRVHLQHEYVSVDGWALARIRELSSERIEPTQEPVALGEIAPDATLEQAQVAVIEAAAQQFDVHAGSLSRDEVEEVARVLPDPEHWRI